MDAYYLAAFHSIEKVRTRTRTGIHGDTGTNTHTHTHLHTFTHGHKDTHIQANRGARCIHTNKRTPRAHTHTHKHKHTHTHTHSLTHTPTHTQGRYANYLVEFKSEPPFSVQRISAPLPLLQTQVITPITISLDTLVLVKAPCSRVNNPENPDNPSNYTSFATPTTSIMQLSPTSPPYPPGRRQ